MEDNNSKINSHLTDNHHIRRAKHYGVHWEQVDILKIYERDNFQCGLCGKKVDLSLPYPDKLSASLDHVIPLSKGGTHTEKNVQLSHLHCNLSKGG